MLTDLWILQNVGELFPLHGRATIGAAMASLAVSAAAEPWFRVGAASGFVGLFSDGDPCVDPRAGWG